MLEYIQWDQSCTVIYLWKLLLWSSWNFSAKAPQNIWLLVPGQMDQVDTWRSFGGRGRRFPFAGPYVTPVVKVNQRNCDYDALTLQDKKSMTSLCVRFENLRAHENLFCFLLQFWKKYELSEKMHGYNWTWRCHCMYLDKRRECFWVWVEEPRLQAAESKL